MISTFSQDNLILAGLPKATPFSRVKIWFKWNKIVQGIKQELNHLHWMLCMAFLYGMPMKSQDQEEWNRFLLYLRFLQQIRDDLPNPSDQQTAEWFESMMKKLEHKVLGEKNATQN